MSEATPITPDAPVADAPVEGQDAAEKQAGEVLDNLSDVRVEDVGGFTSALSHLIDVAKTLVKRYTAYENETDVVAKARMAIRPYMIRTSGLPDWAGTSQGYKAAVESAEFALYVKLGPEAKRKLDQNVRKAVERKHRVPAVVSWILTHENGFGEEAEKFAADPDSVLAAPSEDLKRRVQFHFANSFVKKDTPLTIPDTFSQFRPAYVAGDDGKGGPGQGGPKNAVGIFDAAVGGLTQIRPDYAVSSLLRGFSDLSKRLTEAEGEIRHRNEIETMLDRVEAIAFLTAKHLRGESSPAEIEKLATLYWSKDDQPKDD